MKVLVITSYAYHILEPLNGLLISTNDNTNRYRYYQTNDKLLAKLVQQFIDKDIVVVQEINTCTEWILYTPYSAGEHFSTSYFGYEYLKRYNVIDAGEIYVLNGAVKPKVYKVFGFDLSKYISLIIKFFDILKSNIRQLVDYLFGRKDYQKFERKYKAEDVLNVATALIINNQMELLDSIVTHIFLKMKANQTYSENDWNLIVDILKISLDSKCLKSKLYELLVENIEDANSSPILTKLKSSLSSTQIGTLIGILRELETNTGAQKIQFIIRFLSQDSNSTLKNHIDDDDTLKPSPCTSSQRSVSMIFSNLNSDSTATATATATAATAATAASKLTSTPA